MAKNRKQYKNLEPRYKWYWHGEQCYYCGDKAETVDHCPAISLAYQYGADHLEKKGVKLFKVSCCSQCNSILSNLPIMRLDGRAKHIYNRLMKKYRTAIETSQWEWEDLEDLGPNLKSMIGNFAAIQKWVEMRLRYIEDIFYDVI